MAFEILDKSIDDDSDSDGQEFVDDDPSVKPARPETGKTERAQEAFAALSINKSPGKQRPTATAMNRTSRFKEEEDEEDDPDEDDSDDPFADSNAVHTPKIERPGMTW